MPKKKQKIMIMVGVGVAALIGGVIIFKDKIGELVTGTKKIAPDGTTKISPPAFDAGPSFKPVPAVPGYTPAQMQTFMKPSIVPTEGLTRPTSRITASLPEAKSKLALAVKELEKDPDSVVKTHEVKKSLKQLKKAAAKAAA